MGRFVSATGQLLLATYGQSSCPPTGSFSCPLTQDLFRDRDGACLVIFHRRHFTSRRFFRICTRYPQPTQIEIDISPSQCRKLAPTKSAVSGNHYQDAVPFGVELSCELPEFGVGNRLGFIPLDLW